MPESYRPADGFRLLLVLEGDAATGATYQATVYTPTDEFAYRATISLPKGEVALTPRAQPAEEAPHAALLAQLRTIARGKVKDLDQPWPRRILRWRPKAT